MSGLRISIIQTALHWEDKTANLDMLQKKIEGIPDKPELIILPEMFSTGFSMNKELLAETMDGPTIAWMKTISRKKNAILTGSLIIKELGSEQQAVDSEQRAVGREETNAQTHYYNRLIWMLPNGELGFYDKRHLFAYGKEDQHYDSGNKRLIASVNGWKINCQVCYDLRFPVWIRQNKTADAKPEYDLLIMVANWPFVRSLAWRTLLQARAIENQCYVIGVNRTGTDGKGLEYGGESMVIGPLGELIRVLGNEEEIYSHTLDRHTLDETRLKFPFWQDGDQFLIQPGL